MTTTSNNRNMSDTTIQHRIRASRERASMTQRELAEALGVAYQAEISRWEIDRRPHPRRVRQIAEVLGVSVSWLATGEGKP